MLNDTVKPQDAKNAAQIAKVLKLSSEFFKEISFDEVEEMLEQTLYAYISQTSTPPLRDIQGKIFHLDKLLCVLDNLNNLTVSNEIKQ